MKYIFILLFFIPLSGYTDSVCLEKKTGKLIEYQSGNIKEGTLIQNAVNGGWKLEEVEELKVTLDEWEKIREEQILSPAREQAKKKEEEKKGKKEKIKNKLGLSEEQFQALKEFVKFVLE